MQEFFSLERLFDEIDIGRNIASLLQADTPSIQAAEFMALEDNKWGLIRVMLSGRKIRPDDLSELQVEIIQAILNGVNSKLAERKKAGTLHGTPSLCQALLLDGVFEAVIYDYSINKNWMTDSFMAIWACCVLCPSNNQFFTVRSSSGDAYYKHKTQIEQKAEKVAESKQKSDAGATVGDIIPLYERWLDKGGLDLVVGLNPYKQLIIDIDSKRLKEGIKSKDRKTTYKKGSATIKKDLKILYAFEAWYQGGEEEKKQFVSELATQIGRTKRAILLNINELIKYKNKRQNR